MSAFETWIGELEARHLAELRFAEVSRALRALSATYVSRRGRVAEGAALSGVGKRAAFALFYGPLHFLILREIVNQLPGATRPVPQLLDLGCGTGAAGAAWAVACEQPPRVIGIDHHPWALEEAQRTYDAFGLSARTKRGGAEKAWPEGRGAVLAAFVLNELADDDRDRVLERLIGRAEAGDRVLVVEPIAARVTPWWNHWRTRVLAAGGRADEWRVRTELPAIVAKLDRAAGMNHRELTARTFYF